MPCPFMLICKQKVDFEKYRKYCSSMTGKYRLCPEYEKLSSEYKTPREWNELISGRE